MRRFAPHQKKLGGASSVPPANFARDRAKENQSQSWSTKMTDQEIIDIFDRDLNITLAELARMSGRSVKAIKKILMA